MSLRLEDIELIKQLKYKYCRGIDTCDIALLDSIMTDDMSVDYLGGSYHFQAEGKAAVLAALKAAFHPNFVGSHTVHHPIIEVHDDGTADGHWTLIDYSLNLNDLRVTQGSSFYKDRYRFEGGQWKLQRASYTRLYEMVETLPARPTLTAHLLGGYLTRHGT